MSEAELIFTALAELSTRQIAESTEAIGLPENKLAGKSGGNIAKKSEGGVGRKNGKKGCQRGKLFATEKEQYIRWKIV